MILTRDEILRHAELPKQTVSVPEWGGEVVVRGMTALEQDQYDLEIAAAGRDTAKMAGFRARLVARCVTDENGKRIFSEADAAKLGEMFAAPIVRLTAIIRVLSASGEGSAEEEIESAEKN